MIDSGNDFILEVGIDSNAVKNDIQKIKKELKSKPIEIPIKANVDNSFKQVIETLKHLNTANGKSTGNAATLTAFVNGLKKSVVGLNNFSKALGKASASVYALEARAKKAASGVAKASSSQPSSSESKKDIPRGITNLMALPGVAMIGSAIYRGVSGLKNFGMGSVDMFNTQRRSEIQFSQVLKNSGMGETEFNDIKDYAGKIQRQTMFGDEAMLAGAGELATYVKNPQQMKAMMALLADYAAGMTGGQQVNAQQMVDLATGLGKAFDGTYDSLRKKGFDTSRLEELKGIEENIALAKSGAEVSEKQAKEIKESLKAFAAMGGDIETEKIKALQEALKDWKGLAQTFTQTDEGKIAQLNNDLGDLRENLGEQLQPIVAGLAVELRDRLPEIKGLFDNFVEVWKAVADLIKKHADNLIDLGNGFAHLLKWLANYGTALGTMVMTYKIIIPLMTWYNKELKTSAAASAAAGSGFSRLGGALAGIVNSNALALVASGIVALGVTAVSTWRSTYKANMKAFKNEKFNTAEEARKKVDAAQQRLDEASKITGPGREYAMRGAQEELDAARNNFANEVKLYSSATGGEAMASWGKYFSHGLSEDNANGGYGRKIKFSINDLQKDEDFQRSLDELNAIKTSKQEIINYQPKITQNNNISTDFDSLGKLIKENLREIAISRLTFKTSSEAAKAMAI